MASSLSSTCEPQRITITICGDGGCGKSSITLRLVRSQWTHEYDPTIEDSYSITRRVDGQTYHLSLTDTAGQEEYRGMWASSNLRSDAFLLVYDITNKDSLAQLQEFNDLIDIESETRYDAWEREIRSKKNAKGKRELEPVKPIKIVAGNKCDLQESRQVLAREGLEWARKRGCGFMETSARNTVNIEETFALIVRRVVEARRGSPTAGGMSLSLAGGSNTAVGGAGNGKRNTVASLAASNNGMGTRRAVTAPLSPLPNGPEKEMSFEGVGEKEKGTRRRDKMREFLRGLRCWG